MLALRLTLAGCFSLMAVVGAPPPELSAQPLEAPGATTELSCAFAMMQGQGGHECRVPFPQGCQVAHVPETNKPWTTISKGGRVLCRFDENRTDWKTTITGACGRCRSNQCSVKFSVRFDCSHQQ
jgi:hypothetical protein